MWPQLLWPWIAIHVPWGADVQNRALVNFPKRAVHWSAFSLLTGGLPEVDLKVSASTLSHPPVIQGAGLHLAEPTALPDGHLTELRLSCFPRCPLCTDLHMLTVGLPTTSLTPLGPLCLAQLNTGPQMPGWFFGMSSTFLMNYSLRSFLPNLVLLHGFSGTEDGVEA